ncbi:MAG: TonB-dependent receptor plug domain-containing protein [Sphingobacterium sp.]
MKITLLILLLALSGLNAKTHSQTINLTIERSSLISVLKKVEAQSNYSFVYDRSDLEGIYIKNVELRSASIQHTLDFLLSGKNIEYKLFGTNVVLKKTLVPVPRQADRVLEGRIVDDQGVPLPGASVNLKGTDRKTSTDMEGNFKLTVPDRDSGILVATFIGYLSKEVEFNEQNNLLITLEPDQAQLDEVVVIGYGTEKKANITGSVATVDLKRQENAPVTNASQLLQGVEGVYVNQPGGQPGRDQATIRVRGQGTLNNNNPLVLVNGIEFPMDNVNPADVESITVLKDAASAAIYGSRAANGVVLITTKSGTKGQFQVNYDTYFGFQEATYLPDFVKDPIQFMRLRNQAPSQ